MIRCISVYYWIALLYPKSVLFSCTCTDLLTLGRTCCCPFSFLLCTISKMMDILGLKWAIWKSLWSEVMHWVLKPTVHSLEIAGAGLLGTWGRLKSWPDFPQSCKEWFWLEEGCIVNAQSGIVKAQRASIVRAEKHTGHHLDTLLLTHLPVFRPTDEACCFCMKSIGLQSLVPHGRALNGFCPTFHFCIYTCMCITIELDQDCKHCIVREHLCQSALGY